MAITAKFSSYRSWQPPQLLADETSLQSPSSTLELQPGRGQVTRMRQNAECCWLSNGEANSCANQLGVGVHWEHLGSVQGCWASTGGVPVIAEQGEGFVTGDCKWDRTSLGHEAKAGPAPMKGAGSWQLPRSWWEPVQAQSGDRMIYHIMGCSEYCLVPSAKTLPLRWDSPLGPEQGTTPCPCREMYPSTLCLLSGYQSMGMPAQHLSKVLNSGS